MADRSVHHVTSRSSIQLFSTIFGQLLYMNKQLWLGDLDACNITMNCINFVCLLIGIYCVVVGDVPG